MCMLLAAGAALAQKKIHFWLPVLIFSSKSCERSSSKSQLTQENLNNLA